MISLRIQCRPIWNFGASCKQSASSRVPSFSCMRQFLPRLMRRLRGGEAPRWIDEDELASRLEEAGGIAVIDVRMPDEFTGPLGHIAGSSNMPIGELPERLSEIKALKDIPVILVCWTDKRSANAAALLQGAGFRDVWVLRGGMERWNRSGRPVDGRAAVASA
ncbi:MAG: rhodanese-like domain-containing protein [Reyranella sp.]|nr:MAG: rhodanese-like domain-containing protein [Reyranella sp.]